MASDSGGRPEVNAPMATLGQGGAALATAGTQFLSQVLEIAGRRAGDAIVQALASRQAPPSDTSWIDALVGSYRDYLGEMAGALPLVARRLVHDLQAGVGNRLLLRLPDAALPPPPDVLLTTKATLDRIRCYAAREHLEQDELPGLLEGLPELLEGDSVRDLPKLFDRLKYDFRRRGRRALPGIRKELRWLTCDEHEKLYALVDALTAALGEACVRKVLRKDFLVRYAQALRGSGCVLDEVPVELRCAFKAAGIELSEELSLLVYTYDCLLLDHGRDCVFEVRARELPREVYGAREGTRYEVCDTRLLLPARVQDAAQGLAVWAVDKQLVQDELDSEQPADSLLKAWDIGANRTPVALFMVDYREGDLGPYLELGLGCFATPKGDPLAVGMYVLGKLPVTTPLASEAGKIIWGYPKEVADLDFSYRDRTATCKLRKQGDAAEKRKDCHPAKDMLILTLPRGGGGSSGPLPLFSYTLKGDLWHRTVITRTGAGETVRGGGGVALTITPAGTGDALCEAIKRLGLVGDAGKLAHRPLFATWTEHMSAELAAPRVVTVPDAAEKPSPRRG